MKLRALALVPILAIACFCVFSCAQNTLQVRLHVSKGFSGKLRIKESESVHPNSTGIVEAVQVGDFVLMPKGFTRPGTAFRIISIEEQNRDHRRGILEYQSIGYDSEVGWHFVLRRVP